MINSADEIDNLRGEITFLFHVIEAHHKEIERLREALQSIAKNTCCGACQEAALVARKALEEKE